jgi:Uma2 family endonuclease
MNTLARVRIGPADHGKSMNFGDFQRAVPVSGHNYELARGVIEVTDIPGRTHALVLNELRRQLARYWATHDEVITFLGGGADAKTELPAMASERHPDLSIYLTPMPADDYPWDKRVPAVVVEVVSPGPEARTRDYQSKREEYLAAGALEYWIVDPEDEALFALRRQGDVWIESRLKQTGTWKTPLLPGFELDVAALFACIR